jgi:hypothetical protein
VRELVRMQLAVDGYRTQAGVPARKQRFDVFAAVARSDYRAVPDLETRSAKRARESGYARGKLAIAVAHRCSNSDCGERREAPRAAQQQRHEIMRGR